jgi:DMSO/TMAO reductase YedYZ molybdopterin-dependent catalytic subunit
MRFGSQPPGPFRREFWRSPIRGPWLTSFFGSILLVGIPILIVTGLLSHLAYNADLAHNATTPRGGLFGIQLFDWPTRPYWLYRVTQGTHVILGLALVPVLLAKLWSVIPRLFDWPPIKSPAQLLERASLVMLVGGAGFEFVTGILNVQYWYVFPGSFYRLHYYGAWVFIAGFVSHVAIKLPKMIRTLHGSKVRDVLRVDTASTKPDRLDEDGLVSPNPAAATISRRGAIGLVGAGSLSLFLLTVGQSLGGRFRSTALLAPRGADPGSGPNGFQINKSAREVGITRALAGPSWRLTVKGTRTVVLTRADLLLMEQHAAHLPIACVEGWSTENQTWAGVRLRDLATLVGANASADVFVESLQESGFGKTTLRGNQVADRESLLALHVNGAELSMDHGYPARVIVPNNPGVHNTKWVTRMTFEV